MRVTDKQYARALFKMIHEARKKQEREEIITHFIAYLKRKRRLNRLPSILKAFSKVYNEEEGIQPVEVVTAREASQRYTVLVEKALKAIFQKTSLEITWRHDPSIIGGIQVRMNDLLIDASVKTKIHLLAHTLL